MNEAPPPKSRALALTLGIVIALLALDLLSVPWLAVYYRNTPTNTIPAPLCAVGVSWGWIANHVPILGWAMKQYSDWCSHIAISAGATRIDSVPFEGP